MFDLIGSLPLSVQILAIAIFAIWQLRNLPEIIAIAKKWFVWVKRVGWHDLYHLVELNSREIKKIKEKLGID